MLYQLEQFSFTYPGAERPSLRGLDLTVESGDFLLLLGRSGSGKTTLLRQLKPELAPHGARAGGLRFRGQPLQTLSRRESMGIGFVGQDPEQQIVTDKAWHELAFGLENHNLPPLTIRRRVAETASFFGIGDWFYRDTASLSGGQKQILSLAAATALQPEILLLDEPCAQLDPIAANDFLTLLTRLHRELGITVLISEQRPENLLPLANRALLLEDGCVQADLPPQRLAHSLLTQGRPLAAAMPAAARLATAIEPQREAAPLTVLEGRQWLKDYLARRLPAFTPFPTPAATTPPPPRQALISLRGAAYRYPKTENDVLREVDLTVHAGDYLAVCGANGSGKSTLLKLLQGLYQPTAGRIRYLKDCRRALLPQNPTHLFARDTAEEELSEMTEQLPAAEAAARLTRAIAACGLEGLLNRHPYDMSGGERQRLALAKLLLTEPDMLLLDEPTKGLDAESKQQLARLLAALCDEGCTIVLVTHDIEFAAAHAETAALLFGGGLVSYGPAHDFFAENNFYTTAANRIARGLFPAAVTTGELIAALREASR